MTTSCCHFGENQMETFMNNGKNRKKMLMINAEINVKHLKHVLNNVYTFFYLGPA